MENKKIIDFIINQYEQIQGELMIQEVFANEVDDKIADMMNKTPHTSFASLFTEITAYQELGKEKVDFMNRLEYLKGMMEAYANIIKEIKKEEKEE